MLNFITPSWARGLKWIGIIIFAFLIVSCEQEVIPEPIAVNVTLTQEKALAAPTDDDAKDTKGLVVQSNRDIVKYYYTAEELSGYEYATGKVSSWKELGTSKEEPLSIGYLSQGQWKINVKAVNSSGNTIADGTNTIYINSSTNTIPVHLTPTKCTGNIMYSIHTDAIAASDVKLTLLRREVGSDVYETVSSSNFTYDSDKKELSISGNCGYTSGSHSAYVELRFLITHNNVYVGGDSVIVPVTPNENSTVTGTILPSQYMEETLTITSPGYIEGVITSQESPIKATRGQKIAFKWANTSGATVTPNKWLWMVDGEVLSTTGDSTTYTASDFGAHQICCIALRSVNGVEKELGSANATVNVVHRIANITFDANGGTFPSGDTAILLVQDTYEEPLIPSNPYRDGYRFCGWLRGTSLVVDENGVINQSLYQGEGTWTLLAKWEKIHYNITVVWGENVSGHPYQETKDITIETSLSGYISADSAMVKSGYIFDGWWTEENGKGTRVYSTSTYTWAEDKTIYACWRYKEIIVSFYLDVGGSVYKTKSVSMDLPYGMLPSPVRQGKVFMGWVSSSSQATNENATKVISDTIVTNPNNHSLWAVWGEGNIIVNFDLGLDTATLASCSSTVKAVQSKTIKVALGTEYGTLPFDGSSATGIVTGYEFLGWYDGDTKVINKSAVMKSTNHTLKAKWRGIELTVTLNPNNGGSTQSKTVRYGSVYGDIFPAIIKVGHTLNGWYLGGTQITSGTKVTQTSNHTLTASWSPNAYEVYFQLNGGTGSYEKGLLSYGAAYKNIKSGSTTIGLYTPTKKGYNFSCWSLDEIGSNKVTGDMINATPANHYVYANWMAKTGQVTFYKNITSSEDAVAETRTMTYDSMFGALPELERSGYTLAGWYTSPTNTTVQILPETVFTEGTVFPSLTSTWSVKLYAHWKVKTVSITIDPNGGTYSGTNPLEVPYNSKYTGLIDPEPRTGYTFLGWYKENTKVTSSSTVSDQNDHELKASWSANKYTVIFDAQGGTCSTTSKSVTFAQAYGDLPTPTKTGYDFLGWTYKDEFIASGSSVQVASNHTLEAKWQPKAIAVTYYIESGNTRTVILEYGSKLGEFPNITKTGYAIQGWYYESSYTTKATKDDLVKASDFTLYAKWATSSYVYRMDVSEVTDYWSKADLPSGNYVKISGTINNFNAALIRRNKGYQARYAGTSSASWTQDVKQEYTLVSDCRGDNRFSGIMTDQYSTVFLTPFSAWKRWETCHTCNGNKGWDETCDDCDGSGWRTCGKCDGEGEIVCKICHGTGSYTTTTKTKCSTCSGTGKGFCRACGGIGMTDPDCELCGGTNTYSDHLCPNCDRDTTCSSCNGTGRDSTTDCSICNGKGYTKTSTKHSCPKIQTCPSCSGDGEVSCPETVWVTCSSCEGKGKKYYYLYYYGSVTLTIDGSHTLTVSGDCIGGAYPETITVNAGAKVVITVVEPTTPAAEGEGNDWTQNFYKPAQWCFYDQYDNDLVAIATDGTYISLDDATYYDSTVNFMANGTSYTNDTMPKYYYYPGWIYKDTIVDGEVIQTEKTTSGIAAGTGSMTYNKGTAASVTLTGSALTWNTSSIIFSDYTWDSSDANVLSSLDLRFQ